MTDDEKKHFILKLLISDQFIGVCPDSSKLIPSTKPPLTLSEVNTLCRQMESTGDLKTSSTKDHAQVGELVIIPTTSSRDAHNIKKYLHIGTVNNIEKTLLQFLIENYSPRQIRINHILVASSYPVYDTIQELKKLVKNKLIQMQPPPTDLMHDSNNKLIDDHENAFENLNIPISAYITPTGKSYFTHNYLTENKTSYQFGDNTNFIGGDNFGKQKNHSSSYNNSDKGHKSKVGVLIKWVSIILGVAASVATIYAVYRQFNP
jgi:hypothetical protein